MGIEEKRKAFAEYIDIQSFFDGAFHIGFAVGQGKCQFLHGSTAGFADVITANANGIPFGKFLAAPLKNIGDDAHTRANGIYIGTARGVFI